MAECNTRAKATVIENNNNDDHDNNDGNNQEALEVPKPAKKKSRLVAMAEKGKAKVASNVDNDEDDYNNKLAGS